MKINPHSNIQDVDAKLNMDHQVKHEEEMVPETLAESSKVTVSSRAGEMASIHSQLKEVPEVRMEKVEAIRAQIEAESYNPDSQKVAEKVLTDSLFMSLYE